MAKEDRDKDILYAKLKEAENNLRLSAGYGKSLLEDKQQLEQKLASSMATIDVLNQENFDLKKENSENKNENNFLRGEVDTLIEQLSIKKQAEENESEKLTLTYRRQLEDCVRDQNELKVELRSKCQIIENFEKQKELNLELENVNLPRITQLEQLLQDLQDSYANSINEKKRLEEELQMKDLLIEDCKDNLQGYQQQIETLNSKIVDKDMQISSIYESLEFARLEVSELQGELQIVKSTTDHLDPDKRGNSLFSEVDDRRLKLETLVAQLKKKCETLKHECQEQQRQNQKLQLKLSSVYLTCSRKVNPSAVEELEKELSRAQNEIKSLLASKTVNQEFCKSPLALPPVSSKEQQQDAEYRCLKLLLYQAKLRADELKTEISEMWSERVCGRDQRREHRSKIIRLEQELDCIKSENIRMKNKIEELLSNSNIRSDIQDENRIDAVAGDKGLRNPANQTVCKEEKARVKTSTQYRENVLKAKPVVNECKPQ